MTQSHEEKRNPQNPAVAPKNISVYLTVDKHGRNQKASRVQCNIYNYFKHNRNPLLLPDST